MVFTGEEFWDNLSAALECGMKNKKIKTGYDMGPLNGT